MTIITKAKLKKKDINMNIEKISVTAHKIFHYTYLTKIYVYLL